MSNKHLAFVGRTLGEARRLFEDVRRALPERFHLQPGDNAWLVTWSGDPSKFRGFARNRLAVAYADDFEGCYSSLMQQLAVYETLTDMVQVAEFLKDNEGSPPKPPRRKFKG